MPPALHTNPPNVLNTPGDINHTNRLPIPRGIQVVPLGTSTALHRHCIINAIVDDLCAADGHERSQNDGLGFDVDADDAHEEVAAAALVQDLEVFYAL